MTRYPIPIANNTPPTAAEIMPMNWAPISEDDVLVVSTGLTEMKAPSAANATPDNSNSIPPIMVSIAIIVTPIGLCCLFCIVLDNA